MPSPISMHMPNIAIKRSILRAVMLCSKNFPSLLFFSVPKEGLACEEFDFPPTFLDGRIPILTCLQSREYRAKVPPAVYHFDNSSRSV